MLTNEIEEITKLAVKIGKDNELIQGAGGNVSLKNGQNLIIKASGMWLRDAGSKNIFVSIPLEHAAMAMRTSNLPQYLNGLNSIGSMRASIETSLHLLMPHKVVLHVHCVNTISISVRKDAILILKELLVGFKWEFVPYSKPGAELTNNIRRLIEGKDIDILVLGNHGLVVGGASVGDAANLLQVVVNTLRQRDQFASLHPPQIEEVPPNGWKLPKNNYAQFLAFQPASLKIAMGGSLYPDHVVFLGRGIGAGYDLNKRGQNFHKLQIIKGKFVLIDESADENAEEMVGALAMVVSRIPDGAELRYLTEYEENALLTWEAEHFRKNIPRN